MVKEQQNQQLRKAAQFDRREQLRILSWKMEDVDYRQCHGEEHKRVGYLWKTR